MSYVVRIVAEDPTNNGYILTPLVETILDACGKPNAKVSVISNPRTNGYEHAKSLLDSEIILRYRNVANLLLFLPDNDGKDRAQEFQVLELKAKENGATLICCAAHQEVEAWLLAGHLEQLTATWQEIRADASVKENHFQRFLEQHGDMRRPGSGRGDLMRQTLQNYSGLKSRCPELEILEERLRQEIALES